MAPAMADFKKAKAICSFHKKKYDIRKKKGGGSWEEWLNTIESFYINMSDLCCISTLFQILCKSVYTDKVKQRKNWMVFSRIFHLFPTQSED